MKYCTMAKSMGRDRPIFVEVTGRVRVAGALRPSQSLPVVVCLNHDSQIAAQTTLFLLSLRATLTARLSASKKFAWICKRRQLKSRRWTFVSWFIKWTLSSNPEWYGFSISYWKMLFLLLGENFRGLSLLIKLILTNTGGIQSTAPFTSTAWNAGSTACHVFVTFQCKTCFARVECLNIQTNCFFRWLGRVGNVSILKRR